LPPNVIFHTLKYTKSISAGALPQTPLGELTAIPRTPSWIKMSYF